MQFIVHWLVCWLLKASFVTFSETKTTSLRQALSAPCLFPTRHNSEKLSLLCTMSERIPYICDLDRQVKPEGFATIVESFRKFQKVLEIQNSTAIAIVIVRHLTQPSTTEEVYRGRRDYHCIFEDVCFQLYPEGVERLVADAKFFVKVYASVLYRKWFIGQGNCSQANILALIVFEGMSNDGTKMPIVSLFTGDHRLRPALVNIQLETVNTISQGWPLHWVVGDLIEQLGLALRDFYVLKGKMRQYTVPRWAQYAIGASVLIAVGAMMLEWYVVRRKLTVKRAPTGKQSNASRSKALMLVDSMTSIKRDPPRYH